MNDLLLDDDFDLKIENGDLAIDKSEEQEIRSILALNMGNLKNAPLIGVGLSDFVNSENIEGLKATIEKQLKADNKTVAAIGIENGKLDIKLKQ